MPKYRKRPVVIEARRIDMQDHDAATALIAWCGGLAHSSTEHGMLVIAVPTLEGTMYAADGDWIVKGIKGEFYPVKPDIFEATYEQAEENA
ncbi:hypothetical protein [Streptomyces sp. NPDC017529]|uniref:hypothetical protein n=1 Tax=Streptomyces sp. NPDC017529 TaxID=3365000 RepID=UPI003794D933